MAGMPHRMPLPSLVLAVLCQRPGGRLTATSERFVYTRM